MKLLLLLLSSLPIFTDVSREAGLDFRHSYGDHHLDNIVEGTGSGACFFDYDKDGYQDLFMPTGVWTKGVSNNDGRDLRGKLAGRLYHNESKGKLVKFADVTAKSGIKADTFTSGCTAADYDNDGDLDLFLLNYGPDQLWRNNGDGTFTEVAAKAGLADPRWSVHAVWLDYDNDGDLDVYVANYLLYDDGKFRDFYPAQGYPGPLSYAGQPDAFYRNNGDGTFSEITKDAGLFKSNGRAMSVTSSDLNNDGFMDIFVANDAMENYYFENTGKGTFVERALEMNLAFSEHGQGVASMGPVPNDVNRDGWMDLYIPNLNYCSLQVFDPKEKTYRNTTDTSGVSQIMGQYAGWASVVFDYDHDGWPDVFTVHGNAHHEYVQEDTLARNVGNGKFVDVSRESGKYFQEKYVGRGGSWADIDNDGDIDLLVANLNDTAHLLRNDGGNSQPWLMLDLRLQLPNGKTRTAIGARATVKTPGLLQLDDVSPVRGYLGQGDPRLHFGLAGQQTADLEIRWPDGKTEVHKGVKANQVLTLVHR